ncbi:MAG: MATE family efflux transporter [Bacteroidales bacterium]|jgi:putative MATE family efflux protein|nr:MATE family efflux transporter [Bacteroidales bacterium]MDD4702835.1 MATE family efflux transporter [Bacteroidales bacterium]MDX9798174.1 MATE family efflux transporter [Bacteroidales bacterium]
MSEDKSLLLERDNIGSLLRRYAFPAIIAMIASSLYNIIDSIFIGQKLGAMAISGLALTFPLMNLSAAFGTLVGVGGATLVSISLGRKDHTYARNVLGNVVLLSIVIGSLFTLFTLPFLDDLLYLFGGSENTIEYASDFMFIILIGNIITHLFFGLNAIVRSSGNPQLAMMVTIFSVIINIILVSIFIFVFEWGIAGAAWATVIAQFISLIWLILIFMKRNKLVYFSRDIFRFKKKIVIDIFSIGMSPFLMNATACFVVILINFSLQKYGGDLAIGAYGIINRVSFIFVMIVFGITQGMQPIVGYNYGAKLYRRVLDTFYKSVKWGVLIMTLAFVGVEIFPRAISMIFTTDKQLVDIAVDGFRIVFIVYPLAGFQIVSSNLFQSIGKARQSIFLSLTRQIIFLIPLLIFLPHFLQIRGVWIAMPVSDFLSTLLTAFLVHKEVKQLKALSN